MMTLDPRSLGASLADIDAISELGAVGSARHRYRLARIISHVREDQEEEETEGRARPWRREIDEICMYLTPCG